MKSFIGQRRSSRLQGQRKRRRVPIVFKAAGEYLSNEVLFELKVISQYPSFGEILDALRLYGYRNGVAVLNKK